MSKGKCSTCDKPAECKGKCRSCYKKAYRLKNYDKIKVQERRQGINNRANRLLALAKFRYSTKGRHGYMTRDSKRRGIACSITLRDYAKLVILDCFYCEKPMPRSMGTGLDRIDNSKGYHLDNVLTCCGDCNIMRCDVLTVEETKVAAMAVRSFREAKNA